MGYTSYHNETDAEKGTATREVPSDARHPCWLEFINDVHVHIRDCIRCLVGSTYTPNKVLYVLDVVGAHSPWEYQ